MKTLKLIYILFFIFSMRMFSQNPIIENTTICTTNNSTTTITVTNPSPTASYVWQIKTQTGVWTDITISNAGLVYKDYSTSVLNITRKNTLPLELTKYRVITNNGSGDLISNEAVLTVAPVSVAKIISGASPVCYGGDKQLNYPSDSVGDIQWQSSVTSGTTGFEDINLANGLIYNTTDIQDTTWFRVMNTSGSCNSAFSPAVQVVVNTLAEAGEIEGGDISVCKTLNVTDLYLYNSQGNILWQKSTNVNGPYSNISTATSTVYRASLLSSSTYFRVSVSSGVCPTLFSDPVYIDVNPESVAKSISGTSPVCSGNAILLSYDSGSVGDIQWQSSTTSAFTDFIDETDGNNSSFNVSSIEETTWYRVVNTSGECKPAYSPVFKVVVNPLAEEGFISDADDVIVCRTINSTVLNLNDSVGNIQWQSAADISGLPGTFSNIPLATRNFYSASSLTETTHFRAVLTSGVCPTVITEPVQIIVDQPAVVKSITGATPVCSDGSKVLVYESGSFGKIQWQYSTTSGSEGFNDLSGENFEIYTAYNLLETTWFRVSNTNGVCNSLFSPAVRVLVNPAPVSGTITKVSGNGSGSENLKNTELSLINYKGSIQWQKSKSLTSDFIDIPNATSSIFQTSGVNDYSYFRTVLSSGDCSKSISEPFSIKVNSDFDVTLFPNPFYNELNINLTSLNLDPIEFEVFDLSGRRIDNQKIKQTEINSKKIGTNYLPGFYTIFIKQGEQNKSIKLLKK